MNWYFVLRFLHIGSAAIFIGGILARQVVRRAAEKSPDVRTFAILSQAAGRIENAMVIPGNLAVIIFGVLLALITGAPMLGFLQGSSQNWLLVSNILLLLGLLNVPLVFAPRGRQFDLALQDALAQGQWTPQLRAAVDDKVVRFVHAVEIALIVVVTYLMVFKPF
jgi:uncharacterized membrane protein